MRNLPQNRVRNWDASHIYFVTSPASPAPVGTTRTSDPPSPGEYDSSLASACTKRGWPHALIAKLQWPQGPQSEHHTPRNPLIAFLMVIIASIIAFGYMHSTMMLLSIVALLQVMVDQDMQAWFTVYNLDIGHPCFGQLTPVKKFYPLTSIM